MTGLVIISSMADQGQPNDYAAELQIGTRHLELDSLTALNKSATNYYLQLFNLPFTADARAIGAIAANGGITLAAHKFDDGDAVIATGIPGLTNGTYYVRRAPTGTRSDLGADPNTFYLFDTAANATNRDSLTGLQSPTAGAGSGTVQITGVVPEEMPLPGTGSYPGNIVSYLSARFTRGLYARVVTTAGGSTKGGADVKFTPRFRYAHGAA
jgi:hypothetical protein